MILWKNGILHSLQHESHIYHQMMTDHGLIIGFDDDIKHMKPIKTIDLEGAHLYPGFVDSHIHLMGYGQQLSRPSLKGLHSKKDVLNMISIHQNAIIFEGFEGVDITKNDLEEFGNRALVLRHRDYHAATVNHIVLSTLQITSKDGILKEEDAAQAMAVYSRHSSNVLRRMFKKALDKLYTFGVTGGHSDDLAYFSGFHETLNAMDHVLKDYPFRTHLLMHHQILDDYLESNYPFLDQHAYLQLGAIKIFYDGTFGSKTALVSKPYHDGSYGLHMFDPNVLRKLIKKVRKHHLPLAIHVIGDQGLSELFDLLRQYPPDPGLHDRIIHASMWQDKDLKRAQTMPIICDIQPQFLTSDIPEVLNVFKHKPDILYPWHSLLKNDLIICGGSDAPVEIPDPRLGMYDAIYRETKDSVYSESECLSRYEALKLYTTYANIPTYHTNRGQLKEGNIADFTVLDSDVLTISKTKFKTNKIKLTVINEHIVYKG